MAVVRRGTLHTLQRLSHENKDDSIAQCMVSIRPLSCNSPCRGKEAPFSGEKGSADLIAQGTDVEHVLLADLSAHAHHRCLLELRLHLLLKTDA